MCELILNPAMECEVNQVQIHTMNENLFFYRDLFLVTITNSGAKKCEQG